MALTAPALVACSSDATGLDGDIDENILTATVDGVAFTADDVQVSGASGGSLSFVGTFQFIGTADAGTAATGTVSVASGTFALSY